MIITIYEGYDNSYILLGSRDDAFTRRYGRTYKVYASDLYREFSEIADYVNNVLGDECLFEVD